MLFKLVAEELKRVPTVFGLRAFDGRFQIAFAKSWNDQIVVQRDVNGEWVDFSRASWSEFSSQWVALSEETEQTELETLRAENRELEQRLFEEDQRNSDLDRECATLQVDLDLAKEALYLAEEERDELRAELRDAQKRYADLVRKLSTIVEKCTE